MTQTGRSEAGKQCSSYRTPTTGSGDADKQTLSDFRRRRTRRALPRLGTTGTISENGFSRSPSPLLLITVVSRDLMALHSERCCRDLQLPEVATRKRRSRSGCEGNSTHGQSVADDLLSYGIRRSCSDAWQSPRRIRLWRLAGSTFAVGPINTKCHSRRLAASDAIRPRSSRSSITPK